MDTKSISLCSAVCNCSLKTELYFQVVSASEQKAGSSCSSRSRTDSLVSNDTTKLWGVRPKTLPHWANAFTKILWAAYGLKIGSYENQNPFKLGTGFHGLGPFLGKVSKHWSPQKMKISKMFSGQLGFLYVWFSLLLLTRLGAFVKLSLHQMYFSLFLGRQARCCRPNKEKHFGVILQTRVSSLWKADKNIWSIFQPAIITNSVTYLSSHATKPMKCSVVMAWPQNTSQL